MRILRYQIFLTLDTRIKDAIVDEISKRVNINRELVLSQEEALEHSLQVNEVEQKIRSFERALQDACDGPQKDSLELLATSIGQIELINA